MRSRLLLAVALIAAATVVSPAAVAVIPARRYGDDDDMLFSTEPSTARWSLRPFTAQRPPSVEDKEESVVWQGLKHSRARRIAVGSRIQHLGVWASDPPTVERNGRAEPPGRRGALA